MDAVILRASTMLEELNIGQPRVKGKCCQYSPLPKNQILFLTSCSLSHPSATQAQPF